MKVVLLAGGFGTRISEESQFKPKPMIEIGGMPILWHIMKEYAFYDTQNLLFVLDTDRSILKSGLLIISFITVMSHSTIATEKMK